MAKSAGLYGQSDQRSSTMSSPDLSFGLREGLRWWFETSLRRSAMNWLCGLVDGDSCQFSVAIKDEGLVDSFDMELTVHGPAGIDEHAGG